MTNQPDAKVIELGRQFDQAKAEALVLEKERIWLRKEYGALAQAAGLTDDPRDDKAHSAIMKRCGYLSVSDRFFAKHSEAIKLMKAIHRAKATTLEGFAVKVAAIAFDQSDFEVSDPVPTDVAERMLYRLARDMATAVKPAAHPDAELLKLGAQYRAVHKAQVALYAEVGADESPETMARLNKSELELGELSNRILATDPKTVDGLRVIALCYASCHQERDGSWPELDTCTDARAMGIIMRWLVDGGAA